MTRTKVESSQIDSIGYDPDTKTLEVEFKTGALYHYADVPPEKHEALMKAPSVGRTLGELIKGKHDYKRV